MNLAECNPRCAVFLTARDHLGTTPHRALRRGDRTAQGQDSNAVGAVELVEGRAMGTRRRGRIKGAEARAEDGSRQRENRQLRGRQGCGYGDFGCGQRGWGGFGRAAVGGGLAGIAGLGLVLAAGRRLSALGAKCWQAAGTGQRDEQDGEQDNKGTHKSCLLEVYCQDTQAGLAGQESYCYSRSNNSARPTTLHRGQRRGSWPRAGQCSLPK